jgi:formate dehydrogenase major subunit
MNKGVIFSREPEDFTYMDINVPCQHACPAETNIPAYIRALFEGDHRGSYGVNYVANILPGVLGRICSRPCEEYCRHGEAELGNPVNICHIKRAAADFRGKEQSAQPNGGEKPPGFGKQIAIVGAGPAGLAAAHDLALTGFSVTILEAFDLPGGMLAYGIPEFRLPRPVLQEEISRILSMGVDLRTGIKVGEDVTIESLLTDYEALLVAAGSYEALQLNIPGEGLPGVFPGLQFMMNFCSGKGSTLGKRVKVIGAGFTAFDCARSALRLGAEEVSICLRRTEEDLVVTEEEVLETKKEGIRIEGLMLSQRIMGVDQVEGITFVRTRPGELRPDGKREVTPIEGSEFTVPTDTVIVATGQRPVAMGTVKGNIGEEVFSGNRGSYRTDTEKLYLAGDYLSGPSTVIEAIASGRKAAEEIAFDLVGRGAYQRAVRMEDWEITDRQRAWDFIPRQVMPTIMPVEERFQPTHKEVETGFTKDLAHEESKRCYLCYLHYEIDINRCIYCRYCIDVSPRDCIKMVDSLETDETGAIVGYRESGYWDEVQAIVIDNSRCIRCGECLRVCPVDCISVTKVELVNRFIKGAA